MQQENWRLPSHDFSQTLTKMDIFNYTLRHQIDESVSGKRTFSGVLVDMEGCVCGKFKSEAMLQHCSLRLTVDSHELCVDIRNQSGYTSSVINSLFLPWGYGSVTLDGKRMARYVSYGELVFDNPDWGSFKVIKDDHRRRFLWAREHDCSWNEAVQYSSNRSLMLVSSEGIIASFCGYFERSPLLNAPDRELVAQMPIEKQLGLFAFCLMWNTYRPVEGASCDEEQTAHSSLGDSIPDIPSFVRIERNGEAMLSATPEDVRGGVAFCERFLQFISQSCQWYIGIPLMLLFYAFVRDCCHVFLFAAQDIPEERIWVTGLTCLCVGFLYWRVAFQHGKPASYYFPVK